MLMYPFTEQDVTSLVASLQHHNQEAAQQFITYTYTIPLLKRQKDNINLAKKCYEMAKLLQQHPDLAKIIHSSELFKKIHLSEPDISYEKSIREAALSILEMDPNYNHTAEDLDLFIKILLEAGESALSQKYNHNAISYYERAIILLAKKPADERLPKTIAMFYLTLALIAKGPQVMEKYKPAISFLNTLTPAHPLWKNLIVPLTDLGGILQQKNNPAAIEGFIDSIIGVATHSTDTPPSPKKRKRNKHRHKKNPHYLFHHIDNDQIYNLLIKNIKTEWINIVQPILLCQIDIASCLQDKTATIIPIVLENHRSLLYICKEPLKICYFDGLERGIPQQVANAIHAIYPDYNLANITVSPVNMPNAEANESLILCLMEYYIKWQGKLPPTAILKEHDEDSCYHMPQP